jgi:hypothetical protein
MQNIKPVAHVVGPDGDVLTLADLPPPDTVRWVPRKKARLVAAVCGGLISLNQACLRYRLTPEEFSGWKSALEDEGLMGLQVTHRRRHHPLLGRIEHPPGDGGLRDRRTPAG